MQKKTNICPRKSVLSRKTKFVPKKRRLLSDGSTPERIIQAQILSWLESTGILHWRANSGCVWVHGRRISLGPDGISDVVVVVPPSGRFLGLEIKSAHGKVRPVQAEFETKVLAAGGEYRVVRSLEDAKIAVFGTIKVERWKQELLSIIQLEGGPGFCQNCKRPNVQQLGTGFSTSMPNPTVVMPAGTLKPVGLEVPWSEPRDQPSPLQFQN